jgi:UDP-glucose 4-epimerase
MAKYLITGVAGFIGSHIAEKLLKDGSTVLGVDNFYSGKEENIEFLSSIGGDFNFYRGDIRDSEFMREVFESHKVDGVFHLGAIASVQKSIVDPIFTNSVNVDGTVKILQLCREFKVKRVVFSSSAAVYGDEPSLPKNENSPLSPISPYGVQKLIGEQYMTLFSQQFGVETVSLRYFNVYGERQDPSSEYSGVISIFEDRISRGESPFIYGDGSQYRDFIYVGDVANINILAMERDSVDGKILPVGTGNTTTISELCGIIGDKYKKTIKPIYKEARNGDIRESRADSSLTLKLLKLKGLTEFREGIRRL